VDYNKFNGVKEFCDIDEEILDEELVGRYQKILKEGKSLPKDIVYEEEEGVGIRFFKKYSDEEVEAQLEISRTNSLESIASTLNFFKWLTIVGLLVIAVLVVVFIFKFSALINELTELGDSISKIN